MTRTNRQSLLPLPEAVWYILDLGIKPGRVVTELRGFMPTIQTQAEALAERLTNGSGDTHVAVRAVTLFEME